MTIHYRMLESIDDLEKVVDLEIRVWGLPPRDAVPSNLLHAMVNSGSLVVGASDDDKLIGMALMFPTDQKKHKRLWSHMAAVDPAYQGQGIGFELKKFQRKWALETGYQEIGWTFDPLQRGNANFNLHVLGGATNTYHENFYGEMTDGINAGLPSDRVEVIWQLRNPRVKQLSERKVPSPIIRVPDITDKHYLLRLNTNNQPTRYELSAKQSIYLAEIPPNINALKQISTDLAFEWRIALRHTLQMAFQVGYSAQDFITFNNRHFYVLLAERVWYMYVLECGDQTLYTGISPDLALRLAKHNKGQGASYTKTRRPVTLIAAWQYPNKSSAMKAELAFKQLQRQNKLDYIAQQKSFLNAPFVNYAV